MKKTLANHKRNGIKPKNFELKYYFNVKKTYY